MNFYPLLACILTMTSQKHNYQHTVSFFIVSRLHYYFTTTALFKFPSIYVKSLCSNNPRSRKLKFPGNHVTSALGWAPPPWPDLVLS